MNAVMRISDKMPREKYDKPSDPTVSLIFHMQEFINEIPTDLGQTKTGIVFFGTPGCGKHTIVERLFEGYVHLVIPRDEGSLVVGLHRAVARLGNTQGIESLDNQHINNLVETLNILKEQYILSLFHAVLATHPARDENGNAVSMRHADVGGALMPLITYCALMGLEEIPEDLLEIIGQFPTRPQCSILINTTTSVLNGDTERRKAALSVITKIQKINQKLVERGLFNQVYPVQTTETFDLTSEDPKKSLYSIQNEIISNLDPPRGNINTNLFDLHEALCSVFPERNDYSPILYLSLLSKDRILIPNLADQSESFDLLLGIITEYLENQLGVKLADPISQFNEELFESLMTQINNKFDHEPQEVFGINVTGLENLRRYPVYLLQRMKYLRDILVEVRN